MNIDYSAVDTVATVETPDGSYPVKVVKKPFYDPKKKLASIT
jgi:aminomethyltransferase